MLFGNLGLDNNPLHPLNGRVKIHSRPSKLPPTPCPISRCRISIRQQIPFRLHFFFDKPQQLQVIRRDRAGIVPWNDAAPQPVPARFVIGGQPCSLAQAIERPVVKIDDPAACRLIRSRVQILAVQIGKQAIPVVRVTLDQRGGFFRSQHKPHAEDNRALERFVFVGFEPVRFTADAPRRGEQGRDTSNRRMLQDKTALPIALVQPDMRDFQRRRTGPGRRRDGARKTETACQQLIQPDFTAVALSNGVGGNQSRHAAGTQQPSCLQEKIGAQIGAALSPPR